MRREPRPASTHSPPGVCSYVGGDWTHSRSLGRTHGQLPQGPGPWAATSLVFLTPPGTKMAETVPATGATEGNQQLDTPGFLWELSRGTRPKGGFVVLDKEPAGTQALDPPVTRVSVLLWNCHVSNFLQRNDRSSWRSEVRVRGRARGLPRVQALLKSTWDKHGGAKTYA